MRAPAVALDDDDHAPQDPEYRVADISLIPWFGTNISLIPGVASSRGGSGSRRVVRHLAVQLIVVQLGSYLLNPSLKALFDRARPDMFERRGWYGWSSYPSGHAIASVAVLMTIA